MLGEIMHFWFELCNAVIHVKLEAALYNFHIFSETGTGLSWGIRES